MSVKIGIVVLNFNDGAQTLACVDSVCAQQYPGAFIVLVDNHSCREERERLWQRYGGDPGIQCCFLDENRGYAGGNNAGIRVALERGADFVLIVTADVTLSAGALGAMVEVAAADDRIGIVGPQVVDLRNPRRVLSVGERVYVPLVCVPRTLLRYRRVRPTAYAVTSLLGCVMLLSRRCLEEVGGFDEKFFGYYEEVDLCLRARARAFGLVCAPQAVVTHDGMRGFLSGLAEVSAELKARNLLVLMRRWARRADWLLLAPTYLLLLAGSMAVYGLRGRRDVIRGLLRGAVAGMYRRGGPPACGLSFKGLDPGAAIAVGRAAPVEGEKRRSRLS
jgi:hypothetical protein